MPIDIGQSISDFINIPGYETPVGAAISTCGQEACGNTSIIENAVDSDWHLVYLPSEARYEIYLSGIDGPRGRLIDHLLVIRDSQGQMITSVDNLSGRDSVINYESPAPGFHFLDVQGSGASTGTYWITIRRLPGSTTCIPDGEFNGEFDGDPDCFFPFEPPDDISTEFRVNVGSGMQGALSYPRDSDWYRVGLTSGRRYRFTLLKTSGGGNPRLVVRDPSGRIVKQDDNSAGFPNALVRGFVPTRSGDYFLESNLVPASTSCNYRLLAAPE